MFGFGTGYVELQRWIEVQPMVSESQSLLLDAAISGWGGGRVLGGRFMGGFGDGFFVGFEKVSDFSSLEQQLLDVVVVVKASVALVPYQQTWIRRGRKLQQHCLAKRVIGSISREFG